jgi:NAD(P)-dependent dehydrogenase (short-subunit alcohol dehydrogenase family)
MNTQWQNQTAIITGGADGLGLALTHRLTKLGVRVAVFDVSERNLASAAEQVGALCRPCRVDVTDGKSIGQGVQGILKDWERIDILVNCAGITGTTNLQSHEVDVNDFDRVMAINARGPLLVSQAVLPVMLGHNYGRILHVASIAGKEGNAGMTAYSMSKAAVIALAKVQGKEYAWTGVTVNAIAPAVVRTEMVAALPAEQVEYMTAKIPMKRCGTLEEFAALATFIVSPECSFTTGFTFDLSGGRATY